MERYWSRFAADFTAREEFVVGESLMESVKQKLRATRFLGDVIEFGCGTGVFTNCILPVSDSILATDYSTEMVEAARQIFADESKVRTAQADCCKTEQDNCSFDTVLMANLIHVIAVPEQALRESHRILKDGGTLLLTCFSIEKMSFYQKLKLLFRYRKTFGAFPEKRTNFTVHSLREMVQGVGFDVHEAALLGETTRSIFLRATKATPIST